MWRSWARVAPATINGNGIIDAGDTAGIVGAVVVLYDAADGVVSTVTTAADGTFLFPDLPPGAYYLKETLTDGWESTSADP